MTLKKKSWDEVGTFSCVNFEHLVFENKKVVLTCSKDKKSELTISRLQLASTRTIDLPQNKVKLPNDQSLTLEGLQFYWRKMKSSGGTDKKIHVLSAKEFF